MSQAGSLDITATATVPRVLVPLTGDQGKRTPKALERLHYVRGAYFTCLRMWIHVWPFLPSQPAHFHHVFERTGERETMAD